MGGGGGRGSRGPRDGFVFEGAYRVAGAGWRPGGAWYRGRARAGGGRPRPLATARTSGLREPSSATSSWGRRTRSTAAAAPFDGDLPPAKAIVAAAHERAAALVRRTGASNANDAQLVLAADQFVIDHDGPTAVAGYPWFGEWSRDLMTSYEGLFLSTGRAEEGRGALRRAARRCRRGCSRTPPTPARWSTTPRTGRSGSSTRSVAISRSPETTTSARSSRRRSPRS